MPRLEPDLSAAAAEGGRTRKTFVPVLVVMLLAAAALFAQYQKAPPDFGGSYSFPTPTHPEPRATVLRYVDIAALAACLALSVWFLHYRRSRNGMLLLTIGSVAYFGFYREGCTCAIGATQNVVLCLVDPSYRISAGIIVFFFLPLVATLLFGRVFCGGACPLGAVQDLVLIRGMKVPEKIDRALGWIPYVYLGLAVLFAGWGLHLKFGGWTLNAGRRFLICEWDPFVPLFRMTGSFHMLAIGAGFVLASMFIGRPYCRWLCPYGGLLALLSRVSWKFVSITPDRELDCGLCADACPFGAIHNLRADRATCVSCARCYESCPRELDHRSGRPGTPELVQLEPK